MIGLLYLGFMIGGTILAGIKAAGDNEGSIRRAKERHRKGKNPYRIFIDRRGATRSLDTGKIVSVDYIGCETEGKDQYLRDMYGHPIKNLSEERRVQREVEARLNPDPRRTVVEWKKGIPEVRTHIEGNSYYAGDTYKDLKNGNIYVCRSIPLPKEFVQGRKYCSCYMDVNTGLLVRESDSQKFDRQRKLYDVSEEIVNKFIGYFNEKQMNEGYFLNSNIPQSTGWNETESDFSKRLRLGNYYCNNYISKDIPKKGASI